MAWSYETTVAPTIITAVSYGSSSSAFIASNNTSSISTLLERSSLTQASASGAMVGGKSFYGTGGAKFDFTYTSEYTTSTTTGTLTTTETVTAFESWYLEVLSQSQAGGATTTITGSFIFGQTQSDHVSQTNSLSSSSSGRTQSLGLAGDGITTVIGVTTWLNEFATTTRLSDTGAGTFTTSTSSQTITFGTTSHSFSESLSAFTTYSYIFSTSTDSTTASRSDSTDSSRSYTFPTSTVALGVTTSTTLSSTYSDATFTTTSVSTTVASNQTTTIADWRLFDTVFHPEWTDWAWSTTSTGSGMVSAVAASFATDTTFTQGAIGRVPPTWAPVVAINTYSGGNAGLVSNSTTITQSFTNKSDTTGVFSSRSTTSSTYVIGASTTGTAMLPLTTQRTLTRFYTYSFTRTLDFQSLYTTSFTITAPLWSSLVTFISTFTDRYTASQTGDIPTYTTTFLAGSYPETNDPDTFLQSMTSTRSSTNSTADSSFTLVSSSELGITRSTLSRQEQYDGNSTVYMNQFDSISVGSVQPSWIKEDIAGGFQAWGSQSIGGTYGTNLTVNSPLPILTFGNIFTHIALPLMDSSERAFTVGTSAMTSQWVPSLSEVHITSLNFTGGTVSLAMSILVTGSVDNDKSSIRTFGSTIGGFGWSRSSTDRSQMTVSQGVHMFTSFDSTLGTTASTTLWQYNDATKDMSNGFALNYETAPEAIVVSTEGMTIPNIIVTTYPAFPPT